MTMGKTTKKVRQAPPPYADRVRTGRQGPAGTPSVWPAARTSGRQTR
ncbi:hypothetical protein ACK389_00085 [Streptomyces antibioticus]|uniref:Uncharacterized protein n=1 Tax=Streptomyces antibioticus TaxID=1890 RepID=A0AAE6YFP9_STRAT|nr:hypothetical protein [Streptomyces antibioticus]MCX4740905.1 hypothetical protein [Streptomyces antibioticus]MCX5173691.1 hypothetical protein [Streptomyces antibioticus]QIT48582.1 hypothetical protein HCX60_37925 [Streptomyces antibioticus]